MIHHPTITKDLEKIMEYLSKCDVIQLGLMDGKYPYVVPMNFGVIREGDLVTIYLHCTRDGRKLELIRDNDKAGFSASWFEELPSKTIHCRMKYQSVAGKGRISLIEDKDEQVSAMNALLSRYGKKTINRYSDWLFDELHMLKLEVEEITGKELTEAGND